MTDENLKPHLEDMTKALGEKVGKDVTKDELEKELQKFLEYGVPIDQAKQTILKKFGEDFVVSGERKLIKNIESNEQSVNLLGRIVTINPKDITVKGENKTIFYGILGDESGTTTFTAWKDFGIEKGQVVKISNAYTREWQGTAQLNFGDRTNIEPTDEETIPETYASRECKVGDLKSGLGFVEVVGKLLSITERDVEVDAQKKKVYSGVIGDETGKAQFTAWHDFKLNKGDVIKVSGGYVKSWRGIPQLTFDEKCKVEKFDSSKIPEDVIKTSHLKLGDLMEKKGGLDVTVNGVVLEVRDGSGLVVRCPECNRVLQDGKCSIHGTVEGTLDLRAKLVVDDGTGAINVILNRNLTEKLFGKTLDECKKLSDDASDINTTAQLLKDTLLDKMVGLGGNALTDDFGMTLIAREADFVHVNVKEKALRLLEELRGEL